MNKTSSSAAAILLSMALATQTVPLAALATEAASAPQAPVAASVTAPDPADAGQEPASIDEQPDAPAPEPAGEGGENAGAEDGADDSADEGAPAPDAPNMPADPAGGDASDAGQDPDGSADDEAGTDTPAGSDESASDAGQGDAAVSGGAAGEQAPTGEDAPVDAAESAPAPIVVETAPSDPLAGEPSQESSEAEVASTPAVTASVSQDGSTVTLTAAGGAFDKAWNVAFEVAGPQATSWVGATRQADGSWQAVVAASKTGTGSLTANAWACVGSSPSAKVASTQVRVPSAQATFALAFDGGSKKIVLTATGVTCPSGVSFVSVGIAPPSGATRWYQLAQQGDGSWATAIDPADFSWAAGAYTIVGSICDASWNGVSLGTSSATISFGAEKTAASVSSGGSTLTLTASGGRFNEAWGVSFAVTGSKGTVWVGGKKQADGTWKAEVSSAKVGAGAVTSAAWANIGSSASTSVASSKTTVPAAGAAFKLAYDSSSRKLVLTASSVSCPSGVAFISAGVASPSAPTRWYRLTEQSGGTWSVAIDPADFGWESGTYSIAGSICDASWAGVNAGTAQASVTLGSTSLKATTDANAGTVTLVASGDAIGAAGNVAFAIAGDGGAGHAGTTWYQAKRQADGTWAATVSASGIGSGTCTAQAVATIGGSTRYLAKAQFSIGGVTGTTTVGDLSASGSVTVSVGGVSSATGVKSVAVNVAGGSSSKTYACSKGSNGTWTATVPLADFGYAGGSYTFQATVTDNFGNAMPLSKATKSISVASAVVEAEVDGPYGKLWLGAGGGAASYAWGVSFQVVDAAGTVSWVAASKTASGTWSATLPASSLAYGGGTVSAYANVGSTTVALGSDYFSRISSAGSSMLQRINGYSSPTGYLLAIDTSGCNVGVYIGSQGHWEQVAFWACSPGAYSTPTVTGVFSVGDKGYYFDSYNSRCFYYTQFYGDYLFHSTLYYADGSVMDSRLGMNLSHGCVRLAIDNAKWIYSNIPRGTTVVSY